MPRKHYNISLVLGWHERYDHRIAVGIIKYAHQRGNWRLSGNEWLFRRRRPDSEQADGVIARITTREEHKRMLALGVPVVDIANAYEQLDMPRVVNDDFQTGAMAANHLLDKGYPHLAYVGIDEVSWSNTRKSGLLSVARERAAEEPHCHSVGLSWLKGEPSLSRLTKWLRQLPLPCGILAANDILGYRAGIAAEMDGIRVPDEIGIAGVDNDDVFCELSRPAMTSVSCDCEQIGMAAAAYLHRILSRGILSKDAPDRQFVIPPLGVVERRSTDIRFGRDAAVSDAKKFIVAHVADGINVSDVVQACNLSRRALERRFMKSEGHSLHHAIHETRLALAKTLMLSGKSAGEAGYASGFRTAQHFHHAFKKRFAMTPVEYRIQSVNSGKLRDAIPISMILE